MSSDLHMTPSFDFLSNHCLFFMLLSWTHPGGVMVAVLRLSSIAAIAAKQVLPGENWRPEAYMAALRDTGFTDVRMEDRRHKHITVQAIYASASKWDLNQTASVRLCAV